MSTYEISKSSLLSLKAEILRKQQELTKAKNDNEVKIKILKKNGPLDFKNKGVESRNEADQLTEDDTDLLKQSRSQLEFKSMLYDRLSQGHLSKEQEIIKKQYLVRFDQKNRCSNNMPPNDSEDEPDKYPESDGDYYNSDDENITDPGEKWVEYVDCLGRSRKCLQKDLDCLKIKDSELQKVVEAKKKAQNSTLNSDDHARESDVQDNTNINEESELLSNDMRREILRQQWEKEEEELRNKSNIHYQDILFGEARTHGVGYYGFSKNEEERFKQQESLKTLRAETEKKQQKAQELKALREKQLAARIKAAKDRKRARLGLPPEKDEEFKEPEAEKLEKNELQAEEMKNKEAIEKLLDEARKKHVRPWDIGKDGVKAHYEMTQEEWVDKKRSERLGEFAPPSIYSNLTRVSNSTNKKRKPSAKSNRTEKIDKRGNFKQKTKVSSHLEQEMNPASSNFKVFLTDDYSTNVCGSNYYTFDSSSDSDSESKHKGAKIAPPPIYEYYEPNKKKICKPSKPIDIEESIEAGLKYLRKQTEEKEKINL